MDWNTPESGVWSAPRCFRPGNDGAISTQATGVPFTRADRIDVIRSELWICPKIRQIPHGLMPSKPGQTRSSSVASAQESSGPPTIMDVPISPWVIFSSVYFWRVLRLNHSPATWSPRHLGSRRSAVGRANAGLAVGTTVTVGGDCSATAVCTATWMVAPKSRVGVGSSPEDCADEQASSPTATTKIRIINVFRIGYTYSTSGVSLRDG